MSHKIANDEKNLLESLRKFEGKFKRNNDLKLKLLTERQSKLNEKNKKWEETRENILKREYIIDPKEHTTINFKQMSKFGSMDERFILKRNPEYLANFTINLDKINFFEQASTLAQKMQKSEKNRKKLMKDKLQELKEKDESKKTKIL